LLAELEGRGVGSLDQRTVTVCSGLDLVNITYNNFVAADEKTARVRRIACMSNGGVTDISMFLQVMVELNFLLLFMVIRQ
jgi:PH domain